MFTVIYSGALSDRSQPMAPAAAIAPSPSHGGNICANASYSNRVNNPGLEFGTNEQLLLPNTERICLQMRMIFASCRTVGPTLYSLRHSRSWSCERHPQWAMGTPCIHANQRMRFQVLTDFVSHAGAWQVLVGTHSQCYSSGPCIRPLPTLTISVVSRESVTRWRLNLP